MKGQWYIIALIMISYALFFASEIQRSRYYVEFMDVYYERLEPAVNLMEKLEETVKETECQYLEQEVREVLERFREANKGRWNLIANFSVTIFPGGGCEVEFNKLELRDFRMVLKKESFILSK